MKRTVACPPRRSSAEAPPLDARQGCHFAALIHEACVTNKSSAANDTAVVVANFGVSWAGNVARVASPTRNALKSCRKFFHPHVVEMTHMSVLYPASKTWRMPFLTRKSLTTE